MHRIVSSIFIAKLQFFLSRTCTYSRLPTDVQAEAIPLILGGGDVLMAAETGSGKTGAFCLPVLQVLIMSELSHIKEYALL